MDSSARIPSLFQREIEAVFSELIHERWRPPDEAQWFPPADLYENSEAYLLLADLPGVTADSVELSVRERRVVLCGSRVSTIEVSDRRHVLVERSAGRFCRTFHLEHPVDASRVEVSLEHGVFRALLPKAGAGQSESGKIRGCKAGQEP